MSQNFQAGDFLIFQIESAYGLLRILAIEENAGESIWHLAAYNVNSIRFIFLRCFLPT